MNLIENLLFCTLGAISCHIGYIAYRASILTLDKTIMYEIKKLFFSVFKTGEEFKE